MIKKIFAIYDSKAETYNNPYFALTTGAAIREFELAVQNNDSMLSKYPEDYTLFEIGTFDDSTAEIMPYAAHVSLGKALEYIKENQTQLAAVGE
jgi:hypothetical protein